MYLRSAEEREVNGSWLLASMTWRDSAALSLDGRGNVCGGSAGFRKGVIQGKKVGSRRFKPFNG